MTSVLIVEDERPIARMLRRVLEQLGYDVTVAHGCAEALADSQYVDCAVLDIDLPDGSGLELGKTLLMQRRVGALVFFSGTADGACRGAALALGARFVAKSDGLPQLTSAIAEAAKGAREELCLPRPEASA